MTASRLLRTTGLATILAASASSGAMAQNTLTLDVITVTGGKTSESAVSALAGVSYISDQDLERLKARISSDIFAMTPGITASPLGNDPGAIINIRGLQNFGRVAVTVDGARQNFSRNSHAGNGSFYVEPDLLSSATVVRGPAGNSYGSGAIGGVVAFTTFDADDLLRDGETWALANKTGYQTNANDISTSGRFAVRFNDAFDLVGGIVYRTSNDYTNASDQAVPYTGQTPVSGLVKGTFRPADGHEVEISGLHYDNRYLASRSAGLAPAAPYYASVDDTHTQNTNITGKWTYSDDALFDFAGTVFWTNTKTHQVKVLGSNSGSSGDLGDTRDFDVKTAGLDLHNSSRVDIGGIEHKFTYGVDYFKDIARSVSDLTSSDRSTASATSSGDRAAYGAFVQWDAKPKEWLDLMASLRYDGFRLDGNDADGSPIDLEGGRLSPKATAAISPIENLTFYGTYAEGYRAPSITETFVGGTHQNDFGWIPNPYLKPETARTLEGGINVRFDGVATPDDALRAKFSIFHTMVDDYIDIVRISTSPNVDQYQNVGEARVNGFEAEGTYDLGWSYVSLLASYANARKVSDGSQLNATTPTTKLGATLGLRNAERTLDYGLMFRYANATSSSLGDSDAYGLVDLFANWQVRSNVTVSAGIDNVFNTSYTDSTAGYIVGPPYSSIDSNGRGRTFKIAISGRIGG